MVAFFVVLAFTALCVLLVLLVLFVAVALAVPSDAAVEFAPKRMCSLGTAQRELTLASCATNNEAHGEDEDLRILWAYTRVHM